jgi:hypothetical protein
MLHVVDYTETNLIMLFRLGLTAPLNGQFEIALVSRRSLKKVYFPDSAMRLKVTENKARHQQDSNLRPQRGTDCTPVRICRRNHLAMMSTNGQVALSINYTPTPDALFKTHRLRNVRRTSQTFIRRVTCH